MDDIGSKRGAERVPDRSGRLRLFTFDGFGSSFRVLSKTFLALGLIAFAGPATAASTAKSDVGTAALTKITAADRLTWIVSPDAAERAALVDALARKYQRPVRRVALKEALGKYLSETERNLRVIFAEAEKSHAILVFDEADDLFGTRTPMKDSHDRYANDSVDALLQRM
jgi:hypothetical protein